MGGEVNCSLFAGVLGVEGAGPGDSFFDLGGDSIMSMQLVARARRAGVLFSAQDVFERKTPAGLAVIAGGEMAGGTGAGAAGAGEAAAGGGPPAPGVRARGPPGGPGGPAG